MKKLPLLKTNMTWLQSWMLWKASSLILMSWSWLAVVALAVSYIYLLSLVQDGGGLMDPPPPWVFVMLRYFEQIWPLVENLVMCCTRWGIYYGLLYCWGACDIIQDGRRLGRHLGFYRKLEIVKKRFKLEMFDAGHVEYDIIKHFAAFYWHFLYFSPKKGKKQELFKNGLTICYLWRVSRNHSNRISPNLCQNVS